MVWVSYSIFRSKTLYHSGKTGTSEILNHGMSRLGYGLLTDSLVRGNFKAVNMYRKKESVMARIIVQICLQTKQLTDTINHG